MDREHTCCVTGRRDIQAETIPYVQDPLHQELLQDGRKSGGTAAAIRYAHQVKRIAREIAL